MAEAPKTLLWDSKYDPRWPASFSMGFVKKRTGKISSLFVNYGLLKIRWQVVGFMMNYNYEDVIASTLKLIGSEFPNINVIIKDSLSWSDEESYFHTSGGSVTILLDFESEADEAEFIIRSDSIISSLKNNEDLIRTV